MEPPSPTFPGFQLWQWDEDRGGARGAREGLACPRLRLPPEQVPHPTQGSRVLLTQDLSGVPLPPPPLLTALSYLDSVAASNCHQHSSLLPTARQGHLLKTQIR